MFVAVIGGDGRLCHVAIFIYKMRWLPAVIIGDCQP